MQTKGQTKMVRMMTLEELKTLLGIDLNDVDDDQRLEMYLTSAIAYVKAYCNNPFPDGLPDDVKYVISQIVAGMSSNADEYADGMNGISSANIGGVISYTKGSKISSYSAESDSLGIYQMLRPYIKAKKISFVPCRSRRC